MLIVVIVLGIIIIDILSKGIGKISWEFMSAMPRKGMTEGGILPAIVGTFIVTVITALLSVPLGMGCAVYLNEYARDNQLTRLIRMSIRNLSGVPSIVYGLFGVVLFVNVMHFGTSVLSSGMTLGGKEPAAAGGRSVAIVRQVFGFRSSAWDPMGIIIPGIMLPPGTQKIPQMAPRMFIMYEFSVL